MDPVTLILAALVAGAAAGAKEMASQAVTDGYVRLKALLTGKFAGNAQAIQTLADHEADPETKEKPLAKELQAAGTERDSKVLEAAEMVLKAADEAGIKTKYQIMVTGGKVGIIGDHGHVTMN